MQDYLSIISEDAHLDVQTVVNVRYARMRGCSRLEDDVPEVVDLLPHCRVSTLIKLERDIKIADAVCGYMHPVLQHLAGRFVTGEHLANVLVVLGLLQAAKLRV